MNKDLIKLIPTMTSNTTPSGIASASGTLDVDSLDAWKAFDGINETSWSNIITTSPSWLKYDFLEPKNVIAYSLKSRANAQSPKNWTFEGSNDENTWTVLDTQVNQLQTSWSEERFFYLQSEVNYSKYRINITAYNSTSATNVLIYEFNVYKSLTNKFLILSNNNEISSIKKGGYVDVVPTMTSNTTPSPFKISSSGEYHTSYQAYKAFDKKSMADGDRWISNTAVSWIMVELDKPNVISKYEITGVPLDSANPKDWTLEGSNDGTNWTVLDTQVDIVVWSDWEKKEFNVVNSGAYSKYKLNISANNSHPSTTSIAELRLFNLQSDSILHQSTLSEQNFIDYGMDKSTEIDLNSQIINKVFIEQSSTALGNGKVFSRTIDTTKTLIKKVSIN